MLDDFATAKTPSMFVLTPALDGTGLNLTAANHVILVQKLWNLNEQRQAVARIHRLGQYRSPTSWALHCVGGVDDRVQGLHEIRGRFEARVMHGLMGSKLSYMDLMNAQKARMEAGLVEID